MEARLIIFLMVVSFVVISSAFSCGPGGICFCEAYCQMDCSKTKLPILKVCGFIRNSSIYNVSVLHLELNDYQIIKEFDLQGCDELNELYLGQNEISHIENGSFAIFDRLELLDINNNSLAIYDGTLKQGFKFPLTTKTLKLNGNSKADTSGQASYPDISYLSNLEVLYMDGLNDKIFSEYYRMYKTLQKLVLSGLNGNCNITVITNSTLQNLPHVKIFNMSSCNIENIYAGAFKGVPNVEVLDLSKNLRLGFRMLRNISYSLQFTRIKSLNYSKVYNTFGIGTQFKQRDVCYLWNTTLNELVLNSNRIQLAETNSLILIPKSLKILHVEDNIFTFAPYLLQLVCMGNLREVYASDQNSAHNPLLYEKEPIENYSEIMRYDSDCPYMQTEFLRNISKGTEHCPYFENNDIHVFINYPHFPKSLKIVEFARSNMKYNITTFQVLPMNNTVEHLDFSDNIIYAWIGPIGPFPKLKYLYLSRNYCSHIGVGFFNNFTAVENLQLDENFLGLVLSNEHYGPLIFEGLSNVKVLNLSSNIISYLPSTVFTNMSKLETLDLSVNSIETWIIDVNTLNSLVHINLKFNSFHALPTVLTNKLESNAKLMDKMFTIDLRNNSFTTNCDEKEFLEWMVKHRDNMLYFQDYIFRNKTGAKLSVEQFVEAVNKLDTECRWYTAVIVFSSIGVSVFLSIVVGGIIYKNRWKLRYLMRITKIRQFGYNRLNNDPDEDFTYDAFISYANENLRFILDKIIPHLEEQEIKLCLHDRDFLPGNNIADNILEAIRNSRKTVVILSNEFLKSKWCLYEFNMARMESIYSRGGENCLVVVMYEDVPTRNMTTEMLQWIKSNTYIEYTTEEEGELLFWDNLMEAFRQ
ncbi:toll-like receptor 4 [Mercenaria mercenaria]|uniref:toll-like receptor 4 n=1 Tax=Mercenaria mercenaria TaxID=6596 RepID=UPI00234E6287|nr:toll-like receptor 4 [Mercenaria mercenaria]